jgi:hypothetical protein
MDSLPNHAFRGIDLPFLQNAQGWKIFPHAHRTASRRWRGSVRIDIGRSTLVSRVCCAAERATEAEALQDAKDFAVRALNRIDERLRIRRSSTHGSPVGLRS